MNPATQSYYRNQLAKKNVEIRFYRGELERIKMLIDKILQASYYVGKRIK
jgi:hypothetical protein